MSTKLEYNVGILESDTADTLLEMTYGELIDAQAARFPREYAIIDPASGRHIRYSDLSAESDLLAANLYRFGVRWGDHVAVCMKNRPEWIEMMVALAKLGAIMVTLSPNFKSFELQELLVHSDSAWLIVDDGIGSADTAAIMQKLCSPGCSGHYENFPALQKVFYLGDRQIPDFVPFAELLQPAEENLMETVRAAMPLVQPDDLFHLQYTSGTTGSPKGVLLHHRGIVNNGKISGYKRCLTEKDRECIPLPFFHCFATITGMTACFTHGSAVVIIDKFDPARILEAIQQEGCTSLLGTPTMFINILAHPDFESYDLTSMRTGVVGGAPCPYPVAVDIAEKMHMPQIIIGLGMTETCAIEVMNDPSLPLKQRIDCVGQSVPHVENRIVDITTGLALPDGQVGELLTRGYHVMAGYYKDEKLTREVIDAEGWMHTGDLCLRKPDGTFQMKGRLKDFINRGGEKIYPREIETYLHHFEEIKEAQVVSVPDKKYGEEIAAFIVLQEGASIEKEVLQNYIRNNAASFKVPRYVFFIDSMPLNSNGKVLKYALRSKAAELARASEVS